MAQSERGRKPAWGKIVLILAIAAALGAAWRYTPLAELITLQRITEWSKVARRTPWAPFALVFAYVPAVLVMFPRPLLTLLSVIAFGPWPGLIYSTLGVLTAALATYTAGRYMRYDTIRRIVGEKLDAAKKVLDKHGILSVFALNMSPTPPFAVQGVVAGALRLSIRDYVLGTLLSLVPAIVAWSVFGTQINAALRDPSEVSYWLIGFALVMLVGIAYATKRWLVPQHS